MAMLAFIESITILGMFGIMLVILAACIAVISRAVCRYRRDGKLSRGLILSAALACIPPSAVAIGILTADEIEYNPSIESADQLYGVYAQGSSFLSLNHDGTYASSGITGITSGEWSHHDWNLTLSKTDLTQPRIITVNGVFCVAPFYDGPDGPDGLLLIKQKESETGKAGE